MAVPDKSSLAALAGTIRDDLARRERSREDWVEATVSLCAHLAEGRAKFSSNNAFGSWLKANDLGFVGHQDRAAAIDMGQSEHLAETRKVLEQTERRSLRLIYAEECRFTTAGKTQPSKPKRVTPKRRAPSEEQRQVSVNTEDIIWNAFRAKAADDGETAASALGKLVKEAVLPPPTSTAPDPRADLSLSAQEKLDAAIRAYKRRADVEFEQRVRAEVIKRLDVLLPSYNKRIAEADFVLKSRRGVMPRREYRKIWACLHPDSITDPDRKQKFADAFATFTRLEVVLVAEDELPTEALTLPKTFDELRKAAGR